MKTIPVLRALALFLTVASTGLHAQVPQLLNYQGRVAVGTVNFDGSGQFKFALVNAAGSTTFWSNDGTSVAGSQPTAPVTLTVTKGLYSVLLGDATLPNMTVVPATVFTNVDVRLRVWFNDGPNGFQLLTPDQRLAAVGYAIMAGNVPDGAITSAKIAAGAVGSTHLGSSAVTSAKIASGAITNTQLAAGAVQTTNIAAGTIVNADINATAAIADTKLATISTPGKVSDTALSANVALLNSAQPFTADKVFGSGFQLFADIGSANAPGLAFNGDPNTGIFEPSSNANVVAIATSGAERLRVDSSGRVGIGTVNPANRLTVAGSGGINGSGAAALLLENTSTNGHSWEWVATDAGRVSLIDTTVAGIGDRLLIETNGNVGLSGKLHVGVGTTIGTVSPATPLHVTGGSDTSLGGGGYIMAGSTSGRNIVIDDNEIMARNNGLPSDLSLNYDGGNNTFIYVGGFGVFPRNDLATSLGFFGNAYKDVTAGSFVSVSDARLKNNIQPLHYGLQTVLSLRPVSYQLKTRSPAVVQFGLIAQEVEPIVPEAVRKDENPDHPLALDYNSFIPILIKAAQEQQVLIDGQRAENLELKKRLEAVEKLLSRLDTAKNGGPQ